MGKSTVNIGELERFSSDCSTQGLKQQRLAIDGANQSSPILVENKTDTNRGKEECGRINCGIVVPKIVF